VDCDVSIYNFTIATEYKSKENVDLIIVQANGYANKGNINNVMECIRKIDNSKFKLYPNGIFDIYARLTQYKVPIPNLNELV